MLMVKTEKNPKRISATIDEKDYERLKKLGLGKMNTGLRLALQMAEKEIDSWLGIYSGKKKKKKKE